MNSSLFEFLGQTLGGHAALVADTPGLEDRGFEVWRLLHEQYAPVGANYETDMLQALMSRKPTSNMTTRADALTQYEHDWRKYEVETGDRLAEKVKAAALLKVFPRRRRPTN